MKHEEEIWVDIPNYQGFYKISNYGRVYSIISNKMIRFDRVFGYEQVALYKNGAMKRFKVHRLVMLAFVGESLLQVNHINGIKHDNRLSNLEYVTQSENMLHAYRIGLEKPCDNGFKKKVRIIKNDDCRVFDSIRALCRYLGWDRRNVQKALIIGRNIKGYKIELI